MEHGAVVIWFDPSVASSKVLQEIVEYLSPSGPARGLHVIIAPFDYPDQGSAGRLPAGTQMALDAWHHLQTCAQVSLPVAFDFTSQFVVPPFQGQTYKGDAPEPQTPINPG